MTQATTSTHRSFWDEIARRGVRRDGSRRWFAGVCAGVARRFDVDPVLIRAAVLAASVFGGLGIVLYLGAWILLPDDSGRIIARDAVGDGRSSSKTSATALVIIAALISVGVVFGGFHGSFFLGWGLVTLIAVGAMTWFAMRHSRGTDTESKPMTVAASTSVVPAPRAPGSTLPAEVAGAARVAESPEPPRPPQSPPPESLYAVTPSGPPRPRRRHAGFAGLALTVGAAAIGYGVAWWVHGEVNFPGSRELFAGIGALGLASLTTLIIGLAGRRSIMSAALVVVLGLAAASEAVAERSFADGRDEQTWVPVSGDPSMRYRHGVGRATLDLRQLSENVERERSTLASVTVNRIAVDQGVGELRIIVPGDINAQIVADTGIGDVDLADSLTGIRSNRSAGSGPSESDIIDLGDDEALINVFISLGVGHISIEEG